MIVINAHFGTNKGYIGKTPTIDNYIPDVYLLRILEDQSFIKGHKLLSPSTITLGLYHMDVLIKV